MERKETMQEIVDTEVSYGKDLKIIKEVRLLFFLHILLFEDLIILRDGGLRNKIGPRLFFKCRMRMRILNNVHDNYNE